MSIPWYLSGPSEASPNRIQDLTDQTWGVEWLIFSGSSEG